MRSRNKYQVYTWIIKVIKSCKTRRQLIGCTAIITRFDEIYKDSELTSLLYYEKWSHEI